MPQGNLNNQEHEPVYLIFLGPPGSGKGTQADKLRDRYGLFHLSSGELFRENIARGTQLGLQVKDILAAGALVPDDLTVAMVVDRLHQPDTARGVVFDGFPRTRDQALALQRELEREGKHITRAIYFHVDDDVVIERLGARRVCPKDGATYNLKSKPPRRDETCDQDGAVLVQRDDDRPEVVRKRLEVYRELTEPLIGFYDERGLLSEVNAAADIDTLELELDQIVEEIPSIQATPATASVDSGA